MKEKNWIELEKAIEEHGYVGLKIEHRPDVKTEDGRIYTNCYLNAGKFNGTSEQGEFIAVESEQVTHVRLRTIEEYLSDN